MKKGFTLAELLVTLGIVSVIAVLTLPSLFNNATNAKIGPSLAKAVASFEHANKAYFDELKLDALTDSDDLEESETIAGIKSYWASLANYLILKNIDSNGAINIDTEGYVYTEDGIGFKILPFSIKTYENNYPHLQIVTDCIIDINGVSLPNVVGTDRFYFKLMNDGSLQPYGANGEWKTYCPIEAVPSDYKYCAGHIFENDYKVLYE